MIDSKSGTLAPRFHLRTFGTLALAGPNDATFLGKHGHHRRRLGLLAILAAAGDRGWSRDQLLLFFWPESTQARARHSLDQLLYALKGSVDETLFASANPVRINSEVVSSDVAAFTAAIERGDFAEAVNQYRGPFLDGFYLEDAPEFERWAETERARLKTAYAGALERLALAAESQADHHMGAKWWRKLLEVDPISSRNAAGLIRALMNSGDHAAALQYAEQYESLVSRELGTSVGPAVASLVAEVRADAKTESVTAPKRTVRPDVVRVAAEPVVSELVGSVSPTPIESITRINVAKGTPARWNVRIAAAAIFAAAVLLIATKGDSRPAIGDSSILVLPFTNVSSDRNDAQLVDALTEEVMAALSQIAGASVIARTTSFALRNTTLDARRIGDSVGVTSIVEGSFQKIGSRLRVQVRLIDASKGTTRWTNTYDRDLTDILAVQSEIAASVAQELNLELGDATIANLQRGRTQNFAAYELYLRGRDPAHLRTDSGPTSGLAMLKQAAALDSNFAAAYAAMPFMYVGMTSTAPTPDSARALLRLARAAAEQALALDSLLPEAWAGMGVATMGPFNALPVAQAAFRRAVDLGGGTTRARELLGRNLLWSGRYAEALNEALRASREDPLSATAAANVGEALCVNGRTDEGLAQLARLTTLDRPLRRVAPFIDLCHAVKGTWDGFLDSLEPDYFDYDPWAAMYGYALARTGAVADAKRLQREFIETWHKTGRGATKIALIAAGLGDLDQAFDWLGKTPNDFGGAAAVMYPVFPELHADPRFEKVRQQFGLSKR